MAHADNSKVELKVVLVGSVGTGKTSTVLRFVKNQYKEAVESTIGASYMYKICQIEGREVKFSVWDTAGQEQYHALVPLYFRNAAAVIVVYDITRQKTLEDARQWVKELRNQAPEDVIIAVAGNKADLADLRTVDTREGRHFAQEVSGLFYETSAKAEIGITELFMEIGSKCLEKMAVKSRSASHEASPGTANGSTSPNPNTITFAPDGSNGSTNNGGGKCC